MLHTSIPQTEFQPRPDHFGDIMGLKPYGTFRIGFQNVNKLPANKTSIKSRESVRHMAEGQYDVIMISEVGLFHPKLPPEEQWAERTVGVLNESKAWFAWNRLEPDISEVLQYGGVGIIAADEATHRIVKSSRDPRGLGRWVSVSVQGKEGHTVTFFSVYRPVENLHGASSVYQQHLRHLKVTEEPRQALLDDLKVAVNEVRSLGHHIIIGIDANEDITSKGAVRKLMDDLCLKEAILDRHRDKKAPETYRRNESKYPIDGIFTSGSIIVSNAGYLPYDEGIPSDHRGLWIDVSFSIAFGHKCPPLKKGSPRRLKASDPRLVKKYNEKLKSLYRRLKLPQKLKKIKEQADKHGWTEALEQQYNALHAKSIAIRLKVEEKIRKLHMGLKPWSPRLQQFRDRIALWEMMVRRRKKLKVSMTRLRRYAKKTGLQNNLNVTLEEACKLVDQAYREYKTACSQAVNWRTDHQDALLEALAKKNKTSREKEMKTMVRHERQRRQSRNIKNARGKLGHGRVTKVYYKLPQEDGKEDVMIECSTKQAMDEAIINENIGRFSQAERTPPMVEPLISAMGYYGEKQGVPDVLAGRYEIPDSVSRYTKEFLKALQQPESVKKAGCSSTTITVEEHVVGWKKQKEMTSAEPTGPSFSHYKAAAEDPQLAEFDATIRELPYKYGFSPTSWRRITDVSILKKAGVYVVDKMRTIQLMFSEFNMNNKKLGRDVMAIAEAFGILPDDQHGSRKTMRAIMAALNKRLTMDILRQRRQAGALCSNDAKSCYDRIVHWVAVACLCRAGLAWAPALSMVITLGLAVHYVSTAFGISDRCYGSKRSIPLQGVGQGNGSGPAVWAVISAVIISMMYSAGHGAQFLSPLSMSLASFVCYAFVDDTDLVQVGSDIDTPGEEVAIDMQEAVDRWEGGLRAAGGALEPKKSHWYLIDFIWRHNRWEYRKLEDMPASLSVVDTCGTQRVVLERVDPAVAKETLGVMLSMDGNNIDQVAHLLEKTTKFAEDIRVSHLSKQDVWFALERCILMTLEYCLPATTLTKSEWKAVLAPIMKYVLPKAGVDSSFPRRLVFAPKSYQGLGLQHPWHRQAATHITTLIAESMKPSLTKDLMTQAVEGVILELGLSGSFWDRPFTTFKSVVTPGWITSIWEYTSMHQIRLCDPYTKLVPYWSQDTFLMDEFSEHYEGGRLFQLNQCRMFLRVSCLSEISTTDGSQITFNAWNGKSCSNSWNNYLWPRRQSALPESWWELWRQALRRCFCHDNRKLKTSLGYPLAQPRRWRWFYSAIEDAVYHKEGGLWCGYSKRGLSPKTRSQLRAQYIRRSRLDSPPNDLIPVTVYHQSKKDVVRIDGKPLAPPGLNVETSQATSMVSLSLVQDWEFTKGSISQMAEAIRKGRCLVVSDGSFKEGHCTSAFVLRCLDTEAQIVGVNALPGPIELSDSFRGELAGTVGALEMIRWITYTCKLTGGSVILASDGEGAIRKASSSRYLHPKQPSFDLLQKIREQLGNLPVTINWQWVKGHQSGPNRSLASRLNDFCDKTAKAYWAHVNNCNEWRSSASLQEGWQVWLGQDKLTSVTIEAVYEWAIAFDPDYSPQEYWEEKHQIPHESFHDIDWEAIGRACKQMPASRQRWLPKFLSGFLATNQREVFRQRAEDMSCPRCRHPIEDGRHIVTCKESGARAVWEAGLDNLNASLIAMDTSEEIKTIINSRMRTWFYGQVPTRFAPRSKLVKRALQGQDALGWHNFMYGRAHYMWSLAQLKHYERIGSSKSPKRWMAAILQRLWATAWDMWQHRNHIKFKQSGDSPILIKLRTRLEKLALSADSDWQDADRLILDFTPATMARWTESELRARIASIEAIRKRVKAKVKQQNQRIRPQQDFMRRWLESGTGK